MCSLVSDNKVLIIVSLSTNGVAILFSFGILTEPEMYSKYGLNITIYSAISTDYELNNEQSKKETKPND